MKGGGYSSLIFAIGTHGGSTVNSLIINESRSGSLVEIDLYEHIVYVLSKELVEIPKYSWFKLAGTARRTNWRRSPSTHLRKRTSFKRFI